MTFLIEKMIRFSPQHPDPDTIDRVRQNSPDAEMALDRYYNGAVLFRAGRVRKAELHSLKSKRKDLLIMNVIIKKKMFCFGSVVLVSK
jgi:hypothetical protein